MKSRRDFLKGICGGTVATIMVSPVSESYSNDRRRMSGQISGNAKNIRIGIIGAENSHTAGYGRAFNIEKRFPGVEVQYVWGETDEFARIAAEKGGIPNIVKDPNEMLGKIDALIVDHRHAKYHLEPAIPFVEAGIPTFIDKPFCYRVSEGKQFLELARKYGTPVSSYSTGAYNKELDDIKAQIKEPEKILNIVSVGPCDIESKYGGIFFYGVHSVQRMMALFGEDIDKVMITRNGDKVTAALNFQSGLFATILFIKKGYYGWDLAVLTDKGLQKLESRVKESHAAEKAYSDMITMFRTGKEPRSHRSILKGVAILEALEKSVSTQKWEEVVL